MSLETPRDGMVRFHLKPPGSEEESRSDVFQVDGYDIFLKLVKNKDSGKKELFVNFAVPDESIIYGEIHVDDGQYTLTECCRFDATKPDASIGYYAGIEHGKVRLVVKEIIDPQKFLVDDNLSDVKFKVGEKLLFLHKTILAKYSPVLHDMVMGEDAQPEIDLPDQDPNLFIDFISSIYKPKSEFDYIRVSIVLPFYLEYQITELIQDCENILLSHSIYAKPPPKKSDRLLTDFQIEELCRHIKMADEYSFSKDNLMEKATSHLATVKSKYWEDKDAFIQLSHEARCLVYSKRVKNVENRLQSESDALILERRSRQQLQARNPYPHFH